MLLLLLHINLMCPCGKSPSLSTSMMYIDWTFPTPSVQTADVNWTAEFRLLWAYHGEKSAMCSVRHWTCPTQTLWWVTRRIPSRVAVAPESVLTCLLSPFSRKKSFNFCRIMLNFTSDSSLNNVAYWIYLLLSNQSAHAYEQALEDISSSQRVQRSFTVEL